MALPKSVVQASPAVTAYALIAVDIASVGAATTLDVQVAAPKAFRYDRPVFIALGKAETVLNAGLLLEGVGRVVSNSGKKIEFRVMNATAGALDPTSRNIQFWQL